MPIFSTIAAGMGLAKTLKGLFGKKKDKSLENEALMNLLGGGAEAIFSGLGKKSENKQLMKMLKEKMGLEQEQWKERGETRLANIEERVRPKGEFYNIADPGSYTGEGGTGSLAQIDPMMKQAVMGMMQSRLGQGFGGVDWGSAMAGGGGQQPPAEVVEEPTRVPNIPRGEISPRRGMGRFKEMIKRRLVR